MAICNRDCFNCKYSDCIDTSNDITENEKSLLAESKLIPVDDKRERKKQYMKRYNKKRKAIHDEQMRKWREAHPDYQRNYYWSHKEGVAHG